MSFVRTVLITLSAWCFAACAWAADDYPAKPITMVVPYPPGGPADRMARVTAEELQKRFKQTVLVVNRAGAAGNIGFDWVAKQPADGYTLLLAPASNLTVQSALFKNLPYDLEKDFTPVSLLVQSPFVLVAHPGLPVNSVKELVEYSKANPRKVNFGVPIGAYQHLAGESMKSLSGGDFTAIPYQGTGPAVNDLLGGHFQFTFVEVMVAWPYLQSGKLKPLAIAYKSRAPWLPDVPAMNEVGFPGFEANSWFAVVARSGTPKTIVDRLASEIGSIMQSPALKQSYYDIGAFTVGSTPEELANLIQADRIKWVPMIKRLGIQPN